jgi:Fe-S-cluster containining protein
VPFHHCAECQRCCNVDPAYPPLEITLTAKEQNSMGDLCLHGDCEYLGPNGCVSGEAKPFSCKLYPLAYNPKSKIFYYDVECPLMTEYIQQLNQPDSVASKHLSAMRSEIDMLAKSDQLFLQRNYRVDSEYFELKRLPNQAAKKEAI